MNILLLSGAYHNAIYKALQPKVNNVFSIGIDQACNISWHDITYSPEKLSISLLPSNYLELIDYISPHMHSIFEAYSRASKSGNSWPFQDYMLLLKEHVKVISFIFTNYNPDFVFFSNFPHDGFEIVVSHLSIFYNVRQYSFVQCQYLPCFYTFEWSSTWKKISHNSLPQSAKFSPSDVMPFIKSYCNKLLGMERIFYMKPVPIRAKLKYLIKSVTVNSKLIFKYLFHDPVFVLQIFADKFRIFALEINYKYRLRDHICPNLPLNSPYIYFPLHLQPELTSSFLGGYYCDQSLAIESIAKLAQNYNMNVIVKENPKQNQSHRSSRFFSHLSRFPNVKLAGPSVDTHKLINSAFLVATLSGTVGIEALANNKYVLCLGTDSVWWKDFDNVLKNLSQMGDYIQANSSFPLHSTSSVHSLELLMNNLLNDSSLHCMPGCIDPGYVENFSLTSNQNDKLLYNSFTAFFAQLGLPTT